jgi:NAD-dependent SIR2 family protein deacetylase
VNQELIIAACEIISDADALLVAAGAGMGVESGLSDFRGGQGFWNAYPLYKKMGLDIYDLANPEWFARDPELAWGFTATASTCTGRLFLTRDTLCC